VFSASTALAQSDDEAVLEEIIVTATKRDASIQDLALSVSALSGADLENTMAISFADYVESVPGLAYQGNEPGNDKMIVRGISTSSYNAQLQSTVGVYIDEMPGIDVFIPTSSPDLHMFDVERVEVLRGPQGTLWGSSAMGGALRIISNKPDTTKTEFRARLSGAGVSDGGTDFGVDAVFNVPLSETVALRATAYTRTDTGYLTAANLGMSESNETTVSGGRLSLRFAPSDALTIDITGTTQTLDSDDGYAAYLNDPLDPLVAASAKDRVRYNYLLEPREQTLNMANLGIEYDFGNVKLVSVTTYGESDLDSLSDQTANTTLPLIPLTGGTIFQAGFFNSDESETVTQEIRLVSDNASSSVDWVLGVFYLDNDRTLRSYNGLLSNVGEYPGALLPGDVLFTQDIDNGRNETAIFGEVTWNFSEKWAATVGARYFDNEQDFKVDILFPPFGPGFPPFAITGDTTTSADDINPKFSLAFRPNDDLMFYALASKGFRLGGANQAALGAPFPIPPTYDSDTLWNYELGARTTFNDGRTVLNVTVFDIEWDDVQTTFLLNSPPFPMVPYFVNAGEASSTGVELEVTAYLGESVTVSTALTSTDAKFDSISPVADAIATIEPGAKMPGTPDFQASTSVDFAFPLFGRDSSLRVSHRFVGESNFDLTSTATQGDYHVYGLNLQTQINDKVSVTLFAKNLGDSDGVTSMVEGFAPAGFPDLRYVVRPRTIGLSIQADF